MAFGIQTFDSSGNLVWDSTTAQGGVVVDFREYTTTSGTTVNYPQWAGYDAFLLGNYDNGTDTPTIELDTSGSYPVVTVHASSVYINYVLAIY